MIRFNGLINNSEQVHVYLKTDDLVGPCICRGPIVFTISVCVSISLSVCPSVCPIFFSDHISTLIQWRLTKLLCGSNEDRVSYTRNRLLFVYVTRGHIPWFSNVCICIIRFNNLLIKCLNLPGKSVLFLLFCLTETPCQRYLMSWLYFPNPGCQENDSQHHF